MSVEERRKILKSTLIVGGAVVGAKSLPESWSRPIVDAVLLPAHAQMSPSEDEDSEPDAQCDEQQVSGANEPVTRTIEMGQSSGSFDFSYDMFNIKDRMIVRYEGNELLDTGCVSGSATEPLTYSGTSTQIEVEVIPACEGGNTLWNFTVSCPD